MPASHSHLVHALALVEGKAPRPVLPYMKHFKHPSSLPAFPNTCYTSRGNQHRFTNNINTHDSLAWLELHVTVAKIIYAYEFQLVDGSLDWNREARMSLLWKKPDLNIKLTKRAR